MLSIHSARNKSPLPANIWIKNNGDLFITFLITPLPVLLSKLFRQSICPILLYHFPEEYKVSCHNCSNVSFAYQQCVRGNTDHRDTHTTYSRNCIKSLQVVNNWACSTHMRNHITEKTQAWMPVNDKTVVSSKSSEGFLLQLPLILRASFPDIVHSGRACLSASFCH